jgi:hypothetical protein
MLNEYPVNFNDGRDDWLVPSLKFEGKLEVLPLRKSITSIGFRRFWHSATGCEIKPAVWEVRLGPCLVKSFKHSPGVSALIKGCFTKRAIFRQSVTR